MGWWGSEGAMPESPARPAPVAPENVNLRRRYRVPLTGEHGLEVFLLADGEWRAVLPRDVGAFGVRFEFPAGERRDLAMGTTHEVLLRLGEQTEQLPGTVARRERHGYGLEFPEVPDDRPLYRIVHALQLRWLRTRVRT